IRYAVFCVVAIASVGVMRVFNLDGGLITDSGTVPHTLPVWGSALFGYVWMTASLVVGIVWMRQALLQTSMDQLRSQNELMSGKKFLEQIRESASEVANHFSSLERIENASFRPTLKRFANLMNCERASLWLEKDDGDVECVGLFDANDPSAKHDGMILKRAVLPRYFAALETGQIIDADNAVEDPRTSELKDAYLIPMNIKAILDVALISAAGRMGILCFESVGRTRVWRPEEIVFAHMAGGLLAAAAGMKNVMEANDELSFSRRRFEAVANYT
ncbi:MAG TPA: hypothetical protein DCM48_10815, partial [Thalassospira sp.]|nr:hypothetical protein [Thalassospira sp.]